MKIAEVTDPMADACMDWLAQEFKGVELGDQRLNKRCQAVVKAVGSNPGKSIPQACEDWGSTKAAYRFFENKDVERKLLLEPHIKSTIERANVRKEVLAIQDTTVLNFIGRPGTEGLGPIGTTEGSQGLVVHNSLAVDLGTGEVLGLLDQEVWAREGRYPREETSAERRQRPRESECWQRGIQAVVDKRLRCRVISVFDREGDIYEVLAQLNREGQGYVIRGSWDRLLKGDQGHLFELVRQSSPLGKIQVEVQVKRDQVKRTALLTVRQVTVALCPPKFLKRQGESLTVGVTEVYEEHAPKGCSPLRWILLTSERIQTLEECARVVRIYTYRWKIEEFHMGLKTGCRVEERQFQNRQRLESFLGIANVISIMLLRLRDLARMETSKNHGLTDIQFKILHQRTPDLGSRPSVRAVLRAVARLGGFLARKGDGEPGWRTLWRGMYDLLLMEHGYLLSKNELLSPQPSLICG